jgi:6-phosphogluconate dehydrogenase
MRIGMVGLGKMGANMTRRLLSGGHEVVVYDLDKATVQKMADEGALPSSSLEDLVGQLSPRRAVWIMVPAGAITGDTIAALRAVLERGDIIVDGGNSRYKDTIDRAEDLSETGIELVDAGTSGGVWGLDEGYCLMVGGAPEAVAFLDPIFQTLAPPGGFGHVGPSGAGHYTKMIHNGIEYALMQAYGEGLELLKGGDFDIDVAQVARLWEHGSVIRSWLLELLAGALEKDPGLESMGDFVDDSGEGRWTVEAALDNAIPAPTIAMALFARFASRQDESFSGKVLNALRSEFGGHPIRPSEPGAPRDGGE